MPNHLPGAARLACLMAGALVVPAMGASPAEGAWARKLNAVQTVYQSGVPHTDRNGRRLERFDPERSFFPLGLYHAWHGEMYGHKQSFADFARAGFNCCHLWEGQRAGQVADAAAQAGIQLIPHYPTDDEVKALKGHPSTLAWYLDEEPTGCYWGAKMEEKFRAFERRRDAIKRLDPDHPVFILDCPWMTPPATSWWVRWNSAGDITSHDNYPMSQHHRSLSFDLGIPESVSLAVASVKERQPMWFCAQAFEQCSATFNFAMPTPRQLRCMLYTSLVHGATGILYFALDSWVPRDGGCIGMAPDPLADYKGGGTKPTIATGDQVRMSRALWESAVALNRELAQLRPALLSPTARVPYEVYVDDGWKSVTPDPIRTLLKQDPAGGYTLLVVNVDDAPQRLRVRFQDLRFRATEPFDHAAHFQRDRDALEFAATPYATHVFRITPEAPAK